MSLTVSIGAGAFIHVTQYISKMFHISQEFVQLVALTVIFSFPVQLVKSSYYKQQQFPCEATNLKNFKK